MATDPEEKTLNLLKLNPAENWPCVAPYIIKGVDKYIYLCVCVCVEIPYIQLKYNSKGD